MNVYFTPEDTLGRMLHNFSATAYQIDELNYGSLRSNGFLTIEEPTSKETILSSVDLSKQYINTNLINDQLAYGFSVDGMNPGAILKIIFSNSFEEQSIVIGATGHFETD
jgi:hypothetical protein